MQEGRDILLDVTRLISRGWSKSPSNGIDRVADAYLDHFGSHARFVVQYEGIQRILTRRHSEKLAPILRDGNPTFRRDLLALAPLALAASSRRMEPAGAIYINVGHTNFDIRPHWTWASNSRLRGIYFIHDLIPIRFPHFCRPRAVERHRNRVRAVLRRASGIIVNSQATLKDIRAFADELGESVPPLLAAPLAGVRLPDAISPARLEKPYFASVGTIEPRKNHQLLLDLWCDLAGERGDATPRLVLIGKWGAGSEQVRARIADDPLLSTHVRVLTDCSDEAMTALIAHAVASLQPSFAEGFGLPLVEALELGTPVIASDIPCFRELGQGLPLLIDPSDKAGWGEAVRAALAEGGPSHGDRQAARAAYSSARWPDHFAMVDQWLAAL